MELKSFKHKGPVKLGVPYRYTLELDESSFEYTISYFEMRRHGSPPANVGRPGDVFIDLNPRCHSVYFRAEHEWVLFDWRSPGRHALQQAGRLERSLQPIAHPHLENRYLWLTETYVGWCTKETIRTSLTLDVFTAIDSAHEVIARILKREVEDADRNLKRVFPPLAESSRTRKKPRRQTGEADQFKCSRAVRSWSQRAYFGARASPTATIDTDKTAAEDVLQFEEGSSQSFEQSKRLELAQGRAGSSDATRENEGGTYRVPTILSLEAPAQLPEGLRCGLDLQLEHLNSVSKEVEAVNNARAEACRKVAVVEKQLADSQELVAKLSAERREQRSSDLLHTGNGSSGVVAAFRAIQEELEREKSRRQKVEGEYRELRKALRQLSE